MVYCTAAGRESPGSKEKANGITPHKLKERGPRMEAFGRIGPHRVPDNSASSPSRPLQMFPLWPRWFLHVLDEHIWGVGRRGSSICNLDRDSSGGGGGTSAKTR
ncbi:hypothetical protein PHLCEN_2v12417 [Hermanssonia centrifuga]|uniref:Uncharacterized protein n=1 Tax=Hermanssonia centrifuga TaxID=98765 RepID=A0A2R6NHB5_9APHY|nr:hypothetical protein PHLCEN_2v12417 [Hermanssonia centrifuga]